MRLHPRRVAISPARLCALCIAVSTACRGSTSEHHGSLDAPWMADAAIADGAIHVDAAPCDGSAAPGTQRRALAVIADFSDARLEDWQGPGFNSEADIRAELDAMTAHWAFLSRGLESMQWDIIRVVIPRPLSNTTFPDFNEFRDEVVRLARMQIDPAQYDFNSDGVIDTVWIIASNNGQLPPWLNGGTSRNEDANVFVDGQDSDSVVGRHTGNFNHEVAHTRGVRDTYGDFGTVGDLSIMSNPWPLPPGDFSALERIELGYVTPQVVATGSWAIDVPDANDHLVAFEIKTGRPEEYYLLEYRRRPASGFGSASASNFNGVAIWHVLEPSNEDIDPPLLKLEPADGTSEVNAEPAPADFVFPGNTGLVLPLVVRTYFGGDEVFRITGVRTGPGGAIELDIVVQPPSIGSAPNRVTNPTLESGTQGWISGGYLPDVATFTWANIGANGSMHSLGVASSFPNDVEWSTHVTGLPAKRASYLCGFVKGDSVGGFAGSGTGGTISLSGTFVHTAGLYGTFDFTRECTVTVIDTTSTDVACRLGGFGAVSTGQIWCDDISLTLLDSAFTP